MKVLMASREEHGIDQEVGGVDDDGTLAPVWAFDAQVPAGLSVRWASEDADAVLFTDFLRSLANAGGAVLLMASLTCLAVGYGNPGGLIGWAVVAIVALVLGWISRRNASRRPGGFTVGEIDLILEHRTEVSFGDWNILAGQELPREVAAARVAAQLAKRLAATKAWSSEHLATHWVRLNPTEEARQIQLGAREIYDLRRTFESEISRITGRRTPELELANTEWQQQLQRSWTALKDRLTAFEEYAEKFFEVAALIDQVQAARRLTGAFAQQGPVLVNRTVGHELAAVDLGQLQEELNQMRTHLGAEVDISMTRL